MQSRIVRFGEYEVELETGLLRKRGLRVKLREKSFQVLAFLMERRGGLVTRDELRERLWPGDVFVDFEQGLNAAVARLREALRDSADQPRYIETLPKRGYRFIGSVSEPAPCGEQPVPKKTRLVVLPFTNLSGDPAQEYFSEGMTEEIITELAILSPAHLAVIARTTAMHFKGTHKDVAQIGRELGVDYVLEGSVRRSEDRIRVSAQLIHVTDQTHVWAEKYDAALRDTIKTQSEVAEAVAAQMRIVLPLEEGRPRRAHPLDPDAYETYLRGLYYYGWGEPDGFRKAIECFRETIAKDPAYAPAYARMALAHIFSAFFGFARPADAYPMAQAAARKALELDDTLGEAHTVLGRFRWFHSWDFATAQVELERGVELAPNDPTAHWSLAIFLSVIREDQDAAAHQIALARELDPLSIGVRLAAGWRLYFARHHEHAMQYSRETLGMYEKSLHAWYVLGLAALAQGSFAEATATFEQAVQVFGDPFSAAWLGLVYGSAGEHEKACAMLGWLDQAAAGRHVPAICRAWIHMGLGNNDAAFDWLQKAYSEHDAQLLWMRVTPFYDPLRGEPRFQKLIARLNLPPIG